MKRLLVLLAALVLVAGCSGGSSTSGAASRPRVLRLGVIAPLQAGNVEFGRGIRNSAQLAVDQFNAANPLVRFELVAMDDSSDPAVGQAAARALIEDPLLVGVVGTYNSGVARQVIPVLDSVGVAMISPGNTDPTLTLGPDPSNPVRPFDNYFRVVVPDTVQGPALADYAIDEMGVADAAIVTESKSVSQGLADAFATRFQERGGTILIRQVVPEGTTDYSAILAQVAPTNPSLLFYGGEVPNAATVRTQATAAGIMAPLMGGDGVKAQQYVDLAGADAEGDVASSLGAPVELQPGGPRFLADYEARGFAEPPTDFGPYAYDAANLLMGIAAQVDLDRTAMLERLQAVDTTGVTGRLAFDAFGDTLHKVLTVYQVEGGVFVPREVVTVSP